MQRSTLKSVDMNALCIIYVANHFPCATMSKEYICSAGNVSSSPGLGRCPGEGNGDLFQYFCLEKPGGLQSMGLQGVGRHEPLNSDRMA